MHKIVDHEALFANGLVTAAFQRTVPDVHKNGYFTLDCIGATKKFASARRDEAPAASVDKTPIRSSGNIDPAVPRADEVSSDREENFPVSVFITGRCKGAGVEIGSDDCALPGG